MEKISGIVRGNSRVAAVDLKQAAPVRPGTPEFGRPVGNSTPAPLNVESTAQRAVAIRNEMLDAKKQAAEDRSIQRLADQFFMSRAKKAEPSIEQGELIAPPKESTVTAEEATDRMASGEAEAAPPPKQAYTPRGSYIDVRA